MTEKLSERNVNQQMCLETYKFYEKNRRVMSDPDQVFRATGLSPEHHEFLRNHLHWHKEHKQNRLRAMLDTKKSQHYAEFDGLLDKKK